MSISLDQNGLRISFGLRLRRRIENAISRTAPLVYALLSVTQFALCAWLLWRERDNGAFFLFVISMLVLIFWGQDVWRERQFARQGKS